MNSRSYSFNIEVGKSDVNLFGWFSKEKIVAFRISWIQSRIVWRWKWSIWSRGTVEHKCTNYKECGKRAREREREGEGRKPVSRETEKKKRKMFPLVFEVRWIQSDVGDDGNRFQDSMDSYLCPLLSLLSSYLLSSHSLTLSLHSLTPLSIQVQVEELTKENCDAINITNRKEEKKNTGGGLKPENSFWWIWEWRRKREKKTRERERG